MAVSQGQRIVDLLHAGQGRSAVQDLLGVTEQAVDTAIRDLTLVPTVASGGGPVSATTVTASGEVAGAAFESEGGIGFFGAEPPGAAAAITGALSTVADAPAKAVLTSIITALVATGQATNGTT